ncbi:MAG TPA: hypothetical protein VG651_20445 [Stellaceae bacterium]|nr:hypothetical protein [Stellaceae bacterium]
MVDDDLGRGESPAVGTRAVVLTVAGILVALLAVAFGFELIFRDRIGMTFVVQHNLPAPGVVPDERAAREALEARQRALLAGAGGRLPIETAMRAIAAKGEHAFDPLGAAK